MTARLVRKDGRYLDFDEVTEGSVIVVQKDHEHGDLYSVKRDYPYVQFKAGDIWVVEALANRPRVAVIRNLQRSERSGIRVDALLDLDDRDVLTVGPG